MLNELSDPQFKEFIKQQIDELIELYISEKALKSNNSANEQPFTEQGKRFIQKASEQLREIRNRLSSISPVEGSLRREQGFEVIMELIDIGCH